MFENFGQVSRRGGLTLILLSALVGGAAASAQSLTTLVSFDPSNNGATLPYAGLIADANGDLFGTTYHGGASALGTVFELSPASTSTGYAESILASFDGSHGASPYGGLIIDGNGNLFGTTSTGGTTYVPYLDAGDGTVFEIVMSQCTSNGCPITTLASFDGSGGVNPEAGLITDANGNLFGTTYGGGDYGDGTVFEIVNSGSVAAPLYASTPTTLVSFNSINGDGRLPHAGLIIDAAGNLFGTTRLGGTDGDGTVFAVKTDSTSGTGYASQPLTLIGFNSGNGTDGADPYAGLIADNQGNLFGTTRIGGASSDGTVFEITASGFVPPEHFVGTPGTPNCTGDSISSLTHTYGGIAHAASSLGYGSVKDLQNAVTQYCSQ